MAVQPWLAGDGAEVPTPVRLATRGYPNRLLPLRRLLLGWLRATGASHEQVVAMQVAVGEATANAVEHAYDGAEPGMIWLVAELEPGPAIRVEIGDGGRWRPQHDLAGRGRGLQMMRECVDEMDLARTPHGTTVRLRLRIGAPD